MRGPYRTRKVFLPTKFQNFKPKGVPKKMLKSITLTLDEYEAIRLADYLGKEHLESSDLMNISRPTFTRLIKSARSKLAKSIVEGMELIIEGGNVDIINALNRCNDCGKEELLPFDKQLEICPECGSVEVEKIA